MHALEGCLGSICCTLVPSNKYDSTVLPPKLRGQANDSAPRTMSGGFDLVHSNNIDFKYAWDEAGKVKGKDTSSFPFYGD